MRFVHAADVHLDSPLRGLDEYEGAPIHALRGATRSAFAALIELALAEHVDFVIIAGDLYDGDWPDFNTGLFFVNQVRRLDRAGIPLVLISGNHDAASRITSHLSLPPNVHSFATTQPSTICYEHLRVAVHGQGFARQAETQNLAANYPSPVPGHFNVGVLHTALDGREGHAPYAPCTLEDLLARGYDYWALGHIHVRESVNGSRHPRVEFPGNIQGRHVRESGAKGCLLVTVDERGTATPEFRPLDVFRWETITVELIAGDETADIVEASREALVRARETADGRPLAVRLVIQCTSPLAQTGMTDRRQLAAELRSQLGGDIWIEKIRVTEKAQEREDELTLSKDAMSEIRSALNDFARKPDLAQEVMNSGDFAKLMKRLPPNLRPIVAENWSDVVERALGLLRAAALETE
jgi:DNA repair exonuclease SbcCD nuclease subunit